MKLFLLRHGESEGNKDNKFRGRTDFPLTNNGREQAYSAGEYLKHKNIDIIFSSPLIRAKETAKIVGNILNKQIIIEESFNNIKLGEWEGKTKEFIKNNYPNEWDIWISNPEKLKLKNMETLENIKNRALKKINEIKNVNKYENVLIVTHRAILKPTIAGLIGIQSPFFWKIHIDTAALTIIEWREPTGWILKNLNINHYLINFIEENV